MYRGTSLIRIQPPLGPYSRPAPRIQPPLGPYSRPGPYVDARGVDVSYERGIPVPIAPVPCQIYLSRNPLCIQIFVAPLHTRSNTMRTTSGSSALTSDPAPSRSRCPIAKAMHRARSVATARSSATTFAAQAEDPT